MLKKTTEFFQQDPQNPSDPVMIREFMGDKDFALAKERYESRSPNGPERVRS